MKEVILLEKDEYAAIQNELEGLRKFKFDMLKAVRQLKSNEHHYKNDILVVEVDTKALNKLYGFFEDGTVMICKKE